MRGRLQLVELGERRGDPDDCLGHLEALTAIEAHATRAHFLLAEHLDAMSEPEADARPEPRAALELALELRDAAIASAA